MNRTSRGINFRTILYMFRTSYTIRCIRTDGIRISDVLANRKKQKAAEKDKSSIGMNKEEWSTNMSEKSQVDTLVHHY